MATTRRLSRQQKKALVMYNRAVSEQERYMGSVFVNSIGQRRHEEKVKAAYDLCKSLGMTYEHGL